MTTIAVNTRMLLKNRLDGTGRFAFETLKRIIATHPEVRFVFLFDRPFAPEFVFGNNVTPVVLRPPVRHPFLYYLWYQVAVKSFLNTLKPDLFVSPDGLLSLGASCKQLAVVHDINFKHNPKDLPWLLRHYFNRYYPKSVAAATRVATVSAYSKQDLIKEYGAPADKIDVVYNGSTSDFTRATGGAKDYFLFVGSIHPRKNILRLLQAFELYKQNGGDKKLMIVGGFFWGKRKINRQLTKMRFGNEVIFTGRVDDPTLAKLYGGAFALAYVPLFEGFGLPLLEAMQAEIPIITSTTTSLPEVAGDAALLVDPYSVTAIAGAFSALEKDSALCAKLVACGKKQREKFSWDKTADSLWASIKKSLYH